MPVRGLRVTRGEIPASIAGRDLLAVEKGIAESGVVSPEDSVAYTRSNVC